VTELLGARRLRELFDRHGIRPRKELGQNFVVDPNTIRRIVEHAEIRPGTRVVEIGAGAGSLTLGLAEAGARVTAVEFDRALLPVLAETVGELDEVEIVAADALTFDFGSGGEAVVANLPYNIAVPLVMSVLARAPNIQSMTVMTQKEVGERLAAAPGTKAYGSLSVMVRHRAEARVVMRVSRRAFYPVPGVDSVVVRLRRREGSDVDSVALERVVRAAFAQRRKTLRNTLVPVAGDAARAEKMLEAAGIDPAARAEEVDLDGFAAIARQLG
jgi:16S rRNA (adenine1518-N6/adenine1519-N6)-dimethyltransferase